MRNFFTGFRKFSTPKKGEEVTEKPGDTKPNNGKITLKKLFVLWNNPIPNTVINKASSSFNKEL